MSRQDQPARWAVQKSFWVLFQLPQATTEPPLASASPATNLIRSQLSLGILFYPLDPNGHVLTLHMVWVGVQSTLLVSPHHPPYSLRGRGDAVHVLSAGK